MIFQLMLRHKILINYFAK